MIIRKIQYLHLLAALTLCLLPLWSIAQPSNVQTYGSLPADSVESIPPVQLINSAMADMARNDFESAISKINRAYVKASTMEDVTPLRDVLNAMANVFYESGKHTQSRRFYEQAFVLETKDTNARAAILFNLAHVSAAMGDFRRAEHELSDSLDLSRRTGDLEGQGYTLKAMGANALATRRFDVAKGYLTQALNLFESLEDLVQTAHIYRHLGDVFLEEENFTAAAQLYLQALPTFIEHAVASGQMHTYRGLSASYERLGDAGNALLAFKAYNALLEDLLFEQSAEETQRLQVAFETQRFADQNDVLTVENQYQQAELDYQKRQIQMQYLVNTLAGVIALLTMTLLMRSRQFARRMKLLATTDELTGLFNRRAILEQGGSELQRASRFHRPFCTLMFDIDHFKSINDTYGHEVGDTVLKKVSEVVNGSLRDSDRLGRIGGEEFLLIAPETDLDDAVNLAERVRCNVEAIDFDEMRDRKVTVSIGVSRLKDEDDISDVIRQADEALYISKHEGRNRTSVFQA